MNNIWVAAGSVAGLAVGTTVNFLRSGSIYNRSSWACSHPFNGFIPFQAINAIRQRLISSPNIFHYYLPLIHTIPNLAFALYNTFRPTATDKGFLTRGWQNLSKLVLTPLLHQNSLFWSIRFIGALFFNGKTHPSLHVIFHSLNLLNASKSLEGLAQVGRPEQKKIYTILNLTIALTDAVWFYNSAANCQTVEEIASSIACVALGLISLMGGKWIISTSYHCLQNRFFQKLEVNPKAVEQEKIPPLDQEPVISTVPASLKKHAWTAAGSLIGLTLGCASNLIHRGSLLAKDQDDCFNNAFGGFTPFNIINDFREIFTNENKLLFILSNPIVPCIYLAPLFGYATYNMLTQKSHSEQGYKALAKRGWRQLRTIIIPALYSIPMCIGGWWIRYLSEDYIGSSRIDISGHVIGQMSINMHAMRAMKELSATGSSLQKRTFAILAGSWAITDGIWLYNTAGNCHSVADVIGALATSGLAYGGIEASKFLLNKLYRLCTNHRAPMPNPTDSRVNRNDAALSHN